MDLTERFETIRQAYIDRLAMTMHEARTTAGNRAITEAIVRDGQGAVARGGAFNLPQRVDVLIAREGAPAETVQVSSQGEPETSPSLHYEAAGGLHVKIHPFLWDRAFVHLLDGSAAMEWEPLLSWYEEWFKGDEEGAGDLLLAVHSIADPEDVEDGVTLTIDLGSMPVEAMEELLDALAGLDVSGVELGTPPPEESEESQEV
jgi:hypothetical protein